MVLKKMHQPAKCGPAEWRIENICFGLRLEGGQDWLVVLRSRGT